MRSSVTADDQHAERRVLVVRGDVIVNCDNFRDILVAVVGVEERCLVQGAWCLVLPRQRARRDRLGRVPDEIVGVKSWSWRMEVSDLQVTVVDETLGVLGAATAHVVVGHQEKYLSV